ncbi:MAG TPA: ABC transporter ATP-binding protein [Candidatus Methylomirabilis sp.]|jgi:branched-chain amino acid transport system ATP-binding protein
MLQVTELRSGYGRIEALKGVSLEVRSGEIVALIGANGAGKTTLLKALAGVLPIWAGSITYDGERIERLPPAPRVRRGLSLVPEGRGILHRMTVRENLLMGAYGRPRGGDLEREMDEVVRRFPPLAPRRFQLGGTLSGGEQQMLAIARALMARPRLLMLDEPSLGLAPLMVREIMRVLGELRAQGITILLVEQNARQALQLADRCYILASGRMAAGGEARAMLASPEVQAAYLRGAGGQGPGTRASGRTPPPIPDP